VRIATVSPEKNEAGKTDSHEVAMVLNDLKAFKAGELAVRSSEGAARNGFRCFRPPESLTPTDCCRRLSPQNPGGEA